MLEYDQMSGFLAMISNELGRLDDSQRAAARQDAPRLNPFDYLIPNEVRFSRILAMLLDPQGVHGQGPLFLDELLSTLNLSRDNLMAARVHVEKTTRATRTKRRIDIVVETAEWIIGIENKVWGALDQSEQVADYLHELSSLRPDNYLLLYLTPHGSLPSADSIQKNDCMRFEREGKLKAVAYESIARTLDNCVSKCSARRTIWFAESLRDYIRYQVLGRPHMLETNVVITTLLHPGNEAQLAIALELFRMKEDVRAQLKNKLLDSICAMLPDGWLQYRDREQREPLLGLKTAPDSPWFFTVEVEDGRYWYGIRYAYEATPRQRREVERRCERLRLTIQSEEPVPRYTPFWREFDGNYEFAPAEYSNWEASVKPWLDMTNGFMAKNLLAAAKRIDLLPFADR